MTIPAKQATEVADLQGISMQVACRALQKQALQEAGQVSKVRQLELGVQQAALDHHRLERELASLLQELNQGPLPQLNGEPIQSDLVIVTLGTVTSILQ